MNFDEYQTKAVSTDLGQQHADRSPMSPAFLAIVLGLSGETGEFTDKMKKIYRDHNGQIPKEKHAELVKELGDVLWYVAVMAQYLNVPLSELAEKNIDKLADRKDRGKLSGSGDNR